VPKPDKHRRKPIFVLSLFDGISCGQLALKNAGIPVAEYRASEICKSAIRITQHHFPNTIQLGDVNDLDFAQMRRNGYRPDLILAGSPCQSLSSMGRTRGGLDNPEKSGLFYRFVDAMREFPDANFLLENVASMSHANAARITREINGERAGKPPITPLLIDSALVSAQNRRRLYWCDFLPRDFRLPDDCGVKVTDILEGPPGQFAVKTAKGHAPTRRKPVTGIVAKTSTVTCGQNLPFAFSTRTHIMYPWDLHEAVTRIEPRPDIPPTIARQLPLKARGGRLSYLGAEYALDLPDGEYGLRFLTCRECERLQTLPDDYTAGVAKTNRIHAVGNGWTVEVIAHLLRAYRGPSAIRP
jgi:DNA (cytosine-5)-methyltransferase 3A